MQRSFANLILDHAVAANQLALDCDLIRIGIGDGKIRITEPQGAAPDIWGNQVPSFEVISTSRIQVWQAHPTDRNYVGRTHSLWYGDIHRKDEFGWFEVCFSETNRVQQNQEYSPLAWEPDNRLLRVTQQYGLENLVFVRPFQTFDYLTVVAAASEWAEWLARAASDHLIRPPFLREQEPRGSWRTAGSIQASRIPDPRL